MGEKNIFACCKSTMAGLEVCVCEPWKVRKKGNGKSHKVGRMSSKETRKSPNVKQKRRGKVYVKWGRGAV